VGRVRRRVNLFRRRTDPAIRKEREKKNTTLSFHNSKADVGSGLVCHSYRPRLVEKWHTVSRHLTRGGAWRGGGEVWSHQANNPYTRIRQVYFQSIAVNNLDAVVSEFELLYHYCRQFNQGDEKYTRIRETETETANKDGHSSANTETADSLHSDETSETSTSVLLAERHDWFRANNHSIISLHSNDCSAQPSLNQPTRMVHGTKVGG